MKSGKGAKAYVNNQPVEIKNWNVKLPTKEELDTDYTSFQENLKAQEDLFDELVKSLGIHSHLLS